MGAYDVENVDKGHNEDDEHERLEAIYDKCHRFKIGGWKFLRLDFNPIVTIASAVLIWGLVIFCMVEPDLASKEFAPWMLWITNTWTWLYIGTQDVWFVFIVALYFSKYGNMKLGKPDDKPEFNDATYFTMLFAAGIGIGLFYFGVAEAVYHYTAEDFGNRYWGRYSDNQRAQDAMNVTFFHWGLHAWIVYVIVGLLLAFVAYRQDLPMSIRSCFHPLLGDRIYGYVGDLIDILSVVCTMFGVCTSLGLGVMQLNAGLHRMNSDISIGTTTQVIIIWCVTGLATLSVISGMKVGIRRLSEICFGLGLYIMLVIMFYDDTWYILNVFVQSTGYYLQTILQIGFHTDAFAMEGNAPDGKENTTWMNDWTIFYWGWWIAWSPFVGMFIAKISKGRTIKTFIMHCMTIPVVYSFLWMSIFGGVGVKMERESYALNITCDSEFGGAKSTEPGPNGVFKLSCRTTDDMWFDVMQSYEGIGDVLSVLSLAAIILYFTTSSDSGSLVIDCLSANGHPDPPIIQRIFWALTEGATATALLTAGGSKGLTALRTVSIAAGLPYTILLNFFCIALWRAVQKEAGDLEANGPAFYHDIFDILTLKRLKKLLIAVVAPWYFIGRADGRLNGNKGYCTMVANAIAFYAWIILMILEVVHHGLAYLAWPCYIGFAVFGCGTRSSIREQFHIVEGNLAEDLFAVMLMYPFAAVQMDEHMENASLEDYKKKNDDYEFDGKQNGAYPMSAMPPSHIEAGGKENPAYTTSNNSIEDFQAKF